MGEVLEIKKTLVDATEPFNHKRDKAACFLRVFQYLCPHAAPRFNKEVTMNKTKKL